MTAGSSVLAAAGEGLRQASVLYVFLETRDLESQRAVIERSIGLPVIEVEPHLPHERHGVVKYDAGNLILSLNLSTPSRFAAPGSDALVMVLGSSAVPGELAWADCQATPEGVLARDSHGHLYLFRKRPLEGSPAVEELRLAATDLGRTREFYEEVLGLEPTGRTARRLRFRTPSLDLVFEEAEAAMDGRPLRRHNHLLVFHTRDIEGSWADLCARGANFKSSRVGYSEIGGTIRLEDPSGNWLCLYQPSPEVLEWGSGPKVVELASRERGQKEE